MGRGAYGDQLGETFRLQEPPALVSSSGRPWRLAVTEMRYEAPDFGFTDPVVPEDAFLLSLELHGLRELELWLDGRSVANQPVHPGGTNFFDLARNPIAHMVDPFHALLFYVPRAALTELCDEVGVTSSHLRHQPGMQAMDPVIEQLGRALLAPLHAEQQTNALFVDHVLLALRSHLLIHYGDGQRPRIPLHRGLAPWQERRAKEVMRASVAEGIALSALAQACHMSPSAFVHGFKRNTGSTPHQWLMLLRTELAMQLMRESNQPLVAIARQTGFADQSHFTRIFVAKTGMTPGVWRKSIPGRRSAVR